MLSNKVYWIVGSSTEGILLILFIISIHQVCITNHFRDEDKPRLRRILLIILNIILFLMLNALVYLSAISPRTILFLSVNIHALYIIIESFTAIISFHTFRLMVMFIINIVYTSSNIRAPKSFTYFIDVLEILFIISVILCHGAAILYNNTLWIYIFYIYLGSTILVLDIFVIAIFRKPMKLYNEIQKTLRSSHNLDSRSRIHSRSGTHSRTDLLSESLSVSHISRKSTSREQNMSKIQSAKQLLHAALFVAFIIIIACLIDITFTVEKIQEFWNWSFDFLLISNIMHSVFVIVLSIALILWIYKPNYCCVIPTNSVCDTWCGSCEWFAIYKRYHATDTEDNDETVKTINSTVQPINNLPSITNLPSSIVTSDNRSLNI
eukprot:124544_1